MVGVATDSAGVAAEYPRAGVAAEYVNYLGGSRWRRRQRPRLERAIASRWFALASPPDIRRFDSSRWRGRRAQENVSELVLASPLSLGVAAGGSFGA